MNDKYFIRYDYFSTMTDVQECISYQPNPLELFIPSPIIISTFCMSTDKTSLFIVSLTRLLIIVTLYNLIGEMVGYDKHPIIRYIFMTMIYVNIIYIGMVVGKNTLFSVGADKSVYDKQTQKKSLDGM
jgi:hypothetical protein